MELAQIIKWVDDTNWHLECSTEGTREYNEDAGYILEYKQYIYAITEQFLKMDKSNKEAFVRRLFRNMDPFVGNMRYIRDSALVENLEDIPEESNDYPEDWESLAEELKAHPSDWTEAIIDEIFDDNLIVLDINRALFIDLLKVYCEVIRLCVESDMTPEEVAHPYHRDITNDLHKSLCLHNPKHEQPEKYRTMPRTHRIEAVKLLLTHTGVSKNIDRTLIAAFVEAVTGGNISVKPKDTESYKTHSKEAEKSAKELLQRIGIEIK